MKSDSSPSSKPMGQDLFVDKPISSAKDDLLGRRPFAQTLAQTILAWTGEDSLTIAVSGDWGTGKTSLKNMVIECLKESGTEAPEIVEFNPWKWGTQDKISSAFFHEISIALQKVDRSAEGKKRVRRWTRYGRYLTLGSETVTEFSAALPAFLAFSAACGLSAYVMSNPTAARILAGFAVLSGVVAAFLKFGGAFATKLADIIKENLADDDELSIHEKKERLREDLKRLPKTVLVVIDDIDRINKEETRSLVQHLKENADFPNMIYFLLYDQQIVSGHLTEPLVSGREFLEKIVQLPFDIPAMSQTLVQRALFSGLDKIIGGLERIELDRRRWGNLFAGALSPFFINLRSVNRFLSTFVVHVRLFQGASAFEVNIVDLIGIEATRVFEPAVYRRIASSKSFLTSGRQRTAGQAVPSEVNAILDVAAQERRGQVLELLRQLFPPIESTLGGTHYAPEFWQTWRDELRVCSADVFDRYFRLGIPEGDLTESEFQEFIGSSGDRAALVEKFGDLRSRGLLDALLNRLNGYAPRLALSNAPILAPALMDIAEDLPDSGSFGLRLDLILVRFLAQEPSVRIRGNIFLEAMRISDGIVLSAEVISNEMESRAKEESSGRSEFKVLEDDQLEGAKTLWIEKVIEASRQDPDALLRNPKLVFLLYRWREWAEPTAPGAWLGEILDSPARAIDFLTSIALQSRSFGIRDYVSREHTFTRLKFIEDFVPLDILTKQTKEYAHDPAILTPRQRDAIQAFQNALLRRQQGRPDEAIFDRG
jgi:predicted KAP-like P-loop ATPase